MTINEKIEIAYFGAIFLSGPCVLCREITYLTARVDGKEIYLCRRNGHWNKEGLRTALERSEG